MKHYLVRGEPDWRDTMTAAALGAGVGAAAFYLARILLARRVVPARPDAAADSPPALPPARKKDARLPARERAGGATE